MVNLQILTSKKEKLLFSGMPLFQIFPRILEGQVKNYCSPDLGLCYLASVKKSGYGKWRQLKIIFSSFPHFLLGYMVELRTSVRRKNFISAQVKTMQASIKFCSGNMVRCIRVDISWAVGVFYSIFDKYLYLDFSCLII